MAPIRDLERMDENGSVFLYVFGFVVLLSFCICCQICPKKCPGVSRRSRKNKRNRAKKLKNCVSTYPATPRNGPQNECRLTPGHCEGEQSKFVASPQVPASEELRALSAKVQALTEKPASSPSSPTMSQVSVDPTVHTASPKGTRNIPNPHPNRKNFLQGPEARSRSGSCSSSSSSWDDDTTSSSSSPERSTTWHHKKERRHSPQSPRVTTTQKQLTQKQIYDAKKSLIEQAVRKIQARLVEETRRSPVLPGDPTIIIGVDATPFNIGGYLINLAQKRGEFYSFPVAQLPWTLSPTSPENIAGNAAEFEILNLMFALYLWRSKLHNSKVLLYTDNFEFNKIQTPYGIRAQKLVRHLKTCEGIEVQIEVRGTNEKGIVDHAKFVKPADDFSRHRFNEGCDFVVDYFGIKPSQLTGSHALKNYRPHFSSCKQATRQLAEVKKSHDELDTKFMDCQKCHLMENGPSPRSL